MILGLTQSKRSFWISGTLLFLIALISGGIGAVYSVENVVNKVSENIDKFEKRNKHGTIVFSDNDTVPERQVDTTFSEPISGFIEDIDNSMVYIKVYPKRELITSGISLEKVDKGKRSKNVNRSVLLLLSFERAYKGRLVLSLYDYDKKHLGKSESRVDKIAGDMAKTNFEFNADVNFALIDYGTLTFSEN